MNVQVIFLITLILGIGAILRLVHTQRKSGDDVTNTKTQLKVIGRVIPVMLLPLLFLDITLGWKIFLGLTGIVSGFASFAANITLFNYFHRKGK